MLGYLIINFYYATTEDYLYTQKAQPRLLGLGPDQNLVPIGVTKLYCDFQLDKYMRDLKMYDGLFKTVA